MAIHISKREVLNNIVRFKASLVEHKGGNGEKRRHYDAMLNCKTGDIRFAKKSDKNKWKQIKIDVETAPLNIAKFDVRVDHRGLAPIALQIMKETISLLNLLAEENPAVRDEILPEEAAFAGISEILVSSFEPIEGTPGWVGEIGRTRAEKMLQSRPVGTYLLRHGDEYTDVMVEQLSENNRMEIGAYLCTIKEAPEKISDVLILLTDMGWTIYRDNPDLSDSEYTYHNSPDGVFKLLSKRAKKPL